MAVFYHKSQMIETNLQKLKVAIVYDRVNKFGGAERVLLTLHEMFPDAPLYTSVYDPKNAPWASVFPKIYTSFLQKIPFAINNHQLFAWLMPLVFEGQFSSEGRPAPSWNYYDLVISVTSEAAKGIITGTKTKHLCYMLTPTRYLWSGYDFYFKNPILKFISKPVVTYLKWWDKVAAQRPDKIIAISTDVQNRIKKYYNRDSEFIFPPMQKLQNSKNQKLQTNKNYKLKIKNYYLYVGRLEKYKKVDLLIETFNELGLPLVIVGAGSEEFKLKIKSKKNINFLGNVNDQELAKIYINAKAFLMPQTEDFGITAVEAQSFGLPVIAYKKGGAFDTVIENKTGIFFTEQTKLSLMHAIAKFDTMIFNDTAIKENAKKFSKERFKRELQRSLIRAYFSWRGRNSSLAKI